MPVPYFPTEAPANRDSVTGPIVTDSDPDNTSTFNQVFQPLWDLLERVKQKAAFLDLASTFTTAQNFAAGLTGTTAALTGAVSAGSSVSAEGSGTEGAPGFWYKTATALRDTALKTVLTNGMACRFITTSTNKLIITINAAWDGSGWVADTPGAASLWLGLSSAGFELKRYTAPDGSPFSDGSFTTGVSFSGEGTKGQVLGFTADNVAVMSNTVRYAELPLSGGGAPGSWEGVFSSATSDESLLYRDVTGYAGVLGTVLLAAGALTGVSATTLYKVLDIPGTGPNNVYLPLRNQSFPVIVQNGTAFYTALMLVQPNGDLSVRGLTSTADSVSVHLGGTRWRTAT